MTQKIKTTTLHGSEQLKIMKNHTSSEMVTWSKPSTSTLSLITDNLRLVCFKSTIY